MFISASELFSHYNYLAAVLLMLLGFFAVVYPSNLVKKMMGLSIFQTSALLIYISSAYRIGGQIPVLKEGGTNYVNPLPHVLMLTGIVVSVAIFALGLALVVKIKRAYGTIYEDEILALDTKQLTTSLQQHKRLEAKVITQRKKRKKRAVKAKSILKIAAVSRVKRKR